MIDFIKKKLNSEDKTSFQITVFIILTLLAVTYFFRAYLLGFVFGPTPLTPDELRKIDMGGYYQHYVSVQASDFVDTGQVLINQIKQKGRVIGEDTSGHLIAISVDEKSSLIVNTRSLPKEGQKTYTGFLSDEMQYSIPSWQKTLELKTKLLPFYLDEAKRPQWWVFLLWVMAVGVTIVLTKEMIYGYPDKEDSIPKNTI